MTHGSVAVDVGVVVEIVATTEEPFDTVPAAWALGLATLTSGDQPDGAATVCVTGTIPARASLAGGEPWLVELRRVIPLNMGAVIMWGVIVATVPVLGVRRSDGKGSGGCETRQQGNDRGFSHSTG